MSNLEKNHSYSWKESLFGLGKLAGGAIAAWEIFKILGVSDALFGHGSGSVHFSPPEIVGIKAVEMTAAATGALTAVSGALQTATGRRHTLLPQPVRETSS